MHEYVECVNVLIC